MIRRLFLLFFYGKEIKQLLKQQEVIMASLANLTEVVAQTNEAVDMVIAQYNALKANAITPAQLDAPVAAISEMKNKLITALQ